MLYPKNGDRIVAIDTVTSLHVTLLTFIPIKDDTVAETENILATFFAKYTCGNGQS